MRLNLGSATAPSNAKPDMNAQLDNLMRAQPADPNAFIAARDDLSRHFASVKAADEEATHSTWAQIAMLQADRDQLYRDIVSQITRDAQRISSERHISGPALDAAVRADLASLTR
jgi:hypothetical protein